MDPVTLIAPNGAEYTTRDPVELNNLVYGGGYRHKPEAAQPDTPDQDEPDEASQQTTKPATKRTDKSQ